MKVEFEKPVTYSTIDRAFTGEGIPPIPEDAASLTVSAHTVVYISPRGEAWECYVGKGTSELSQTFYWPSLGLCPRAWVEAVKQA